MDLVKRLGVCAHIALEVLQLLLKRPPFAFGRQPVVGHAQSKDLVLDGHALFSGPDNAFCGQHFGLQPFDLLLVAIDGRIVEMLQLLEELEPFTKSFIVFSTFLFSLDLLLDRGDLTPDLEPLVGPDSCLVKLIIQDLQMLMQSNLPGFH